MWTHAATRSTVWCTSRKIKLTHHFCWAFSQARGKRTNERKASDPRGEGPFEPFLIVLSEKGHPSSELKCLVGWPAPETKLWPTSCVFIDNGFGQKVSEPVLLQSARGVMVCAPRLIRLRRCNSISLIQVSTAKWRINSHIGLWEDYRCGHCVC